MKYYKPFHVLEEEITVPHPDPNRLKVKYEPYTKSFMELRETIYLLSHIKSPESPLPQLIIMSKKLLRQISSLMNQEILN